MSALLKEPLKSAEFHTVTTQMKEILGTSDKIIVEPNGVEGANNPVSAKTNRFAEWIYRMTEANYNAWEKTGSVKGSL